MKRLTFCVQLTSLVKLTPIFGHADVWTPILDSQTPVTTSTFQKYTKLEISENFRISKNVKIDVYMVFDLSS